MRIVSMTVCFVQEGHALVGMSSSRLEAADDDGVGIAADKAPQAALALAQEQENARVTLYRCMKTLARMMEVRGYDITEVGGRKTTSVEAFQQKARADVAEGSHEMVMKAVVPENPKRYTTAWATGLPPGSVLGVIAISHGNVDTMREVLATMKSEGLQTLILISRQPLTAYSKKFLADAAPSQEAIQHFHYVNLQAAIVDHKLVPKHAPLNAAMSQIVKDRFIGGKFPRLLLTDPMVRFLGLPLHSTISIREVFGREQAVITYFEVYDIY